MMETSLPGVSIIIPNYNYAHFLPRCLDSLKCQSYSKWEAFVVDNNSSDPSQKVVSSAGDPRIKLINFSNDGIIARSRNFGVSLANYPFVAFLDSDDFWHPEKLSIQMKSLRQGWDLSYHGVKLVGNKKHVFSSWGLGHNPTERLLTHGNPIVTSSVVLKKQFFESVEGFPEDEDFLTVEDYYLWLRLAQSKAKFLHIPKKLGYYRIHQSMSFSPRSVESIDHVSTIFLEGMSPIVKKRHLGFVGYDKGMRHLAQKHWSESLENFVVSARLATWRFRWRAVVRIIEVWLKAQGVTLRKHGQKTAG